MCLEIFGCGGSKDLWDFYSLNLCDVYIEVVLVDVCYVLNIMDLKFDEVCVWNLVCFRYGICCFGVEFGEFKYVKWLIL